MTSTTDYLLIERFSCQDCGHDTALMGEYYMVQKEVWHEATVKYDGFKPYMLCIGCLESRLGRMLDKNDFTTASVNKHHYHQSIRLRHRLNRKK